LFAIGHTGAVYWGFLVYEDRAEKEAQRGKRLHNIDEKLLNSRKVDLTWQETTDVLPEDEGERGSEIYYFVDEDVATLPSVVRCS